MDRDKVNRERRVDTKADRRRLSRPMAKMREHPCHVALAVCAALLAVLLGAALASSWQRITADEVSAVHVTSSVEPLRLTGSSSIDGGAWMPYETGQELDAKGVGVHAITVRGVLASEVESGERINVRLSSTACMFRVNGVTVFASSGLGDAGAASEPLLGWVGFDSPGISPNDQVELELSSSSGYCALGDYAIALNSLRAGDANALFASMVESYLPMFISGLVVLVAGLVLLLVASVGHLIGVPKEAGGLRFALFVIVAGVWIFFCFDYITLLIPYPAFTTTVSLLAQDVLGVLLLAFIASRVEGTARTVTRGLLWLLMVALGAAVVLRLAGVVSLYNANIVIVPLFIVACVAAAAVLAVEAWRMRRRIEVDAALVVLPCVVGMFVEGVSFLVGGATTGLWLCGGVLIAVVIRFVALFSFARGQLLKAEQARRMEAELAQSRIAVLLSQIQPHFLFNALNTIEYLCEVDPPLAAKTVEDFARYLRGNMDSLTGSPLIPFDQELAHLSHFVAIEKLRFQNMEVRYDVRERNFLVPPLSVQPLVENAIRHGATRKSDGDGGAVVLSSWREGDRCFVRVTDDGPGFASKALADRDGPMRGRASSGGEPSDAQRPLRDAPRSHVGLANVEERLAATCGGSLKIESVPGRGAQVTITIPYGGRDGM